MVFKWILYATLFIFNEASVLIIIVSSTYLHIFGFLAGHSLDVDCCTWHLLPCHSIFGIHSIALLDAVHILKFSTGCSWIVDCRTWLPLTWRSICGIHSIAMLDAVHILTFSPGFDREADSRNWHPLAWRSICGIYSIPHLWSVWKNTNSVIRGLHSALFVTIGVRRSWEIQLSTYIYSKH